MLALAVVTAKGIVLLPSPYLDALEAVRLCRLLAVPAQQVFNKHNLQAYDMHCVTHVLAGDMSSKQGICRQ